MNDPIDDPILNCITEVCCASGSDTQRATLQRLLVSQCTCDPLTAGRVCDWMIASFDLCEKGSTGTFKRSIARLARNVATS